MLITLLIISVLAIVNFIINCTVLISNQWFVINIRNNNCSLKQLQTSCLYPNYTSVLEFGYWSMCSTQNPKNNCIELKTTQTDRSLVPNFISKYLKNNYFLDVEPLYIDVVQCLSIIGTYLLLLVLIIILAILGHSLVRLGINVYFNKLFRLKMNQKHDLSSAKAKFEYFKVYLQVIFALHVLEMSTRTSSFIIFSINGVNYLNNMIRTSYSAYMNVNISNGQVNSILANYELKIGWSYWLALVSIILSAVSLWFMFSIYFFNFTMIKWHTHTEKKKKQSLDQFVLDESKPKELEVPSLTNFYMQSDGLNPVNYDNNALIISDSLTEYKPEVYTIPYSFNLEVRKPRILKSHQKVDLIRQILPRADMKEEIFTHYSSMSVDVNSDLSKLSEYSLSLSEINLESFSDSSATNETAEARKANVYSSISSVYSLDIDTEPPKFETLIIREKITKI